MVGALIVVIVLVVIFDVMVVILVSYLSCAVSMLSW